MDTQDITSYIAGFPDDWWQIVHVCIVSVLFRDF